MYVLGLGSNLGDRLAALRDAARLLADTSRVRVTATSDVYETEPVGPPQPLYLNAALRVETPLGPESLLAWALEVEARLGRDRSEGVRWGPRRIDIDLLFWSDGGFSSSALQVPHPELSKRSFALAPLLDVAPELAPTYGDMLARLGGPPNRHPEGWRGPSTIEDPARGQ